MNKCSHSPSTSAALWAAVITASLVLSACKPGAPVVTTSTPAVETQTPPPAPTSTREPIGSPLNPPTIGVVSANNDPDAAAAVSELAVRLSEYSGYTVAGRVYPNYDALVTDLQSEAVHITWLPPLTYLWAHAEGLAQPALLVNRYGVYFYGSQFMANVNSGFTQYFDPQTNRSDTDASVALQQLAGKVPCWVEPGSLSGYLLPAALLQENGIQVEEGAMLRSHTAIVRALYVREICDFGVSFAISGDPRTSPSVQDLPAVTDQIVIIWRSEAIIPNLTLALHARMGADMRRSLTDAFLDIGSTPEGRQLISRSISDDVQGLRETDDTAYDQLRAAMSGDQVELGTLIGK